jgi:hypothetical protein
MLEAVALSYSLQQSRPPPVRDKPSIRRRNLESNVYIKRIFRLKKRIRQLQEARGFGFYFHKAYPHRLKTANRYKFKHEIPKIQQVPEYGEVTVNTEVAERALKLFGSDYCQECTKTDPMESLTLAEKNLQEDPLFSMKSTFGTAREAISNMLTARQLELNNMTSEKAFYFSPMSIDRAKEFEIIHDSGASMSVANNMNDFIQGSYKKLNKPIRITGLAKGLRAPGIGIVDWTLEANDGSPMRVKCQALLIPDSPRKLLSPQQFLREHKKANPDMHLSFMIDGTSFSYSERDKPDKPHLLNGRLDKGSNLPISRSYANQVSSRSEHHRIK